MGFKYKMQPYKCTLEVYYVKDVHSVLSLKGKLSYFKAK